MRVERERALMVLRYFAPFALPHHVCERTENAKNAQIIREIKILRTR